jgi:hypothetical protein
MNGEDHSLLGFLKKKTLFKQSPVRYGGKRSRSKSRDSIIRKVADRGPLEQPAFKLQHTTSEKQFKLNQPQINYFEKEFEPTLENNSFNSFKKSSRLGGELQNNLAKPKNPEESYNFSTLEKGNKLLVGVVNYGMSFEAARV